MNNLNTISLVLNSLNQNLIITNGRVSELQAAVRSIEARLATVEGGETTSPPVSQDLPFTKDEIKNELLASLISLKSDMSSNISALQKQVEATKTEVSTLKTDLDNRIDGRINAAFATVVEPIQSVSQTAVPEAKVDTQPQSTLEDDITFALKEDLEVAPKKKAGVRKTKKADN